MSMMPRMNVRLTEPQMAWLQEEAERLGITVADLIRRLIDDYRLRQSSRDQA